MLLGVIVGLQRRQSKKRFSVHPLHRIAIGRNAVVLAGIQIGPLAIGTRSGLQTRFRDTAILRICTPIDPIFTYAVTVDSVEALTGLDFFKNFRNGNNEEYESTTSPEEWLADSRKGDVEILKPSDLGKDQYNTIQAYDYLDSDKKVEICGTVVRTFKSKKNNVFLDLDKQFPNSVFSVSIWSRDIANFSYSPEVELISKKVCVYGLVTRGNKSLQMNISSEKQLKFLDNDF